jgi:SAM-dependent methyltransferase
VDLDEYRDASLRTWDRVSSGWSDERGLLGTALGPVGDRLVERLDPELGQTVLELAAGIGHVGFKVAERLGASGRLISTDFAPAMVARARAFGEELGLDNVEYRVFDAERMDLGDSSVDGVLCRFGYMLMADPAAALAETRRVLREVVGSALPSGLSLSGTRGPRSRARPWSTSATSRRPSRAPGDLLARRSEPDRGARYRGGLR